jgi:rRNA maturation RNase YbeY
MATIHFLTEKISFHLSNPHKISRWLQRVSVNEGRNIDSLTYIFCSDKFLLGLNQHYLQHNTLTDILSFDYSEENESIQGEIYISIPRVKENARKYSQPFEKEVRRVLVHGLLHFVGYRDKSPSEKAQMRIKEEACLSLWK